MKSIDHFRDNITEKLQKMRLLSMTTHELVPKSHTNQADGDGNTYKLRYLPYFRHRHKPLLLAKPLQHPCGRYMQQQIVPIDHPNMHMIIRSLIF